MPLFGPPDIKQLKERRDIRSLIKALGYQNDPGVRKGAARALGELKDSRAVEPLIAALQDKDSDVCKNAAEALGELNDDRAVEPLIAALKDWTNPKTAVQALGKIKDARAVEPLIVALNDRYIKYDALDALVRIGKPAVEAFIGLLKNKDILLRRLAVQALAGIGDPRAIEPLILALKDKHLSDKAADALARISDSRAVEPLIVALKDEDLDVRRTAVSVLVQIGDTRAIEPFITVLKDEDEADSLRAATARALGDFADPRAVEALIAALKSKWVCRSAVEALAQIRDPRAVEPLIATLQDEAVREMVISALARIGDPRAVEPLVAALEDNVLSVRKAAADALEILHWQPDQKATGATYWILHKQCDRCIQIGAPALEPLIAALKDEDKFVRESAAKVLGQIGDPRAVGPLITALDDGSLAAAEALAQIGDPRAVEPLIIAFRDKDDIWSKKAGEALIQIGAPAVEPLIAALSWGGTDGYSVALLLVDIYHGKSLDDAAKKSILAARHIITDQHYHRDSENTDKCGNTVSHDDYTFYMEFPL